MKHQFKPNRSGALPPEICAQLKCARARAGLTQGQLATRIGTSRWFVEALEGAVPRRPSAVVAEQLIAVLALEETADGRALAAELQLLAAPNAGRSKTGFYRRSLEEKAAAARAARARKREQARERASDALDVGGELGTT